MPREGGGKLGVFTERICSFQIYYKCKNDTKRGGGGYLLHESAEGTMGEFQVHANTNAVSKATPQWSKGNTPVEQGQHPSGARVTPQWSKGNTPVGQGQHPSGARATPQSGKGNTPVE